MTRTKQITFRIALLAGALAITGCADRKVDGSSEQAFKDSIAKISEKLPPEQKEKFTSSIALLAFEKVNFANILSGTQTADSMASDARQAINGKTAEQIIAQADAVLAEREAKQRQQALDEIAELIKKKASAESAKAELAKFEVLKSRFGKRKGEYDFRATPYILLAVKNGTQQAVSRAYFRGTIASPDRSIPWLTETFNYEISGGLEPGETAEWLLAPNQFGKWGNVDAPEDAVFTVETIRLDGAKGDALFDSGSFDDEDAKRLANLQEKYGN